MRRGLAIVGLLVLVVAGGIFVGNYAMVGYPLARANQGDTRNAGISVGAHFGYYVNPSVVVFDLEGVSSSNSPMDVFRVFLQFAAAFKDRRFSRVELSHRGTTKFIIAGEYFAQLGAEYGAQNSIYTIRTFPEHLYRPDGIAAYGTWSGGILGVLNKQTEDFNDFHRKSYIEDLVDSR
jgi:hypothetical protein